MIKGWSCTAENFQTLPGLRRKTVAMHLVTFYYRFV